MRESAARWRARPEDGSHAEIPYDQIGSFSYCRGGPPGLFNPLTSVRVGQARVPGPDDGCPHDADEVDPFDDVENFLHDEGECWDAEPVEGVPQPPPDDEDSLQAPSTGEVIPHWERGVWICLFHRRGAHGVLPRQTWQDRRRNFSS